MGTAASGIDYTTVAQRALGLSYTRATHQRIVRHALELLQRDQARGRFADPGAKSKAYDRAHLERMDAKRRAAGVSTRRGRVRQTHCSRGHELIESNLYRSNAGRTCRQCQIDRRAAARSRTDAGSTPFTTNPPTQ